MNPRVSVVMPIFNGASYMTDAIESVLRQTFEDWELILVDDGSSDCSLAIARDYASRYPGKMRSLSHTDSAHRGTSATRNLGAACARGDFIANLDQDDFWTKTKLEEQVIIMDRHPSVAMTFGPMILWSSWREGTAFDADRLQSFTFQTDVVLWPPAFVPLLLSGRNDPHGYLIRRTAFQDVGGYVDNVGICEDWSLYIKIALTYEVYVSSGSNYYYRIHAGQTCSITRQEGQFYSRHFPFFKWLRIYLVENRCIDKQVLQAYRRAVVRYRLKSWVETIMHTICRRKRKCKCLL